jgi:hypothetical protein
MNPMILSVIHHGKNPLECIDNTAFLQEFCLAGIPPMDNLTNRKCQTGGNSNTEWTIITQYRLTLHLYNFTFVFLGGGGGGVF